MEELRQLAGTLTLIFAAAMVLIGLPSQIIRNYKKGENGMSMLMVILPLMVYLSRSTYSFTINAWYIYIPDSLAIIFSLIILFQAFHYRKNRKKKSQDK